MNQSAEIEESAVCADVPRDIQSLRIFAFLLSHAERLLAIASALVRDFRRSRVCFSRP
jgi:hypothetical protein